MSKAWPLKKLGDVCQLISGQHIDSKDYNTESRGVGYLTGPSDFGPIHPIISKWTEHPKIKARSGDILVTVKGSGVGKINLLDQDEVAISRQLMAVRVTGAAPGFVFSALSAAFEHFQSLSTGAAIPGISREQVLGLDLPLPPLPEQRRIVGILDEAFAGIATAKANAEKNLQNARALFESHLHAVFTHRGPGWVEKSLDEISREFGRGKSKHRPRNDPKLYGGKYPFIQTGDVRNSTHVIESFSQTYSELGLAQSKLWPAGTLCITIAANIAETGILGFDACFPDSVIGVVLDEKQTSTKFLEYLLQRFKTHLQALGKGSAQANINLGTFENQRFPFPPLPEQRRITARLDALQAETRRLEALYARKLDKLDELKAALLHQAFSGQL
ncbi:MAG: restriction endonuclease subunit S [Cephaloticoccus sp.]|nr:restriction endonuclease subunit S [Cephaloticoccus sp.]